ncbi:MAG: hypothetical protein E6F98_14060 [Actinobacteria bacterium]|nr:MAG: hypothetical protein E6F98_14060 [Actinomycetota bacterium]
MPDEELDAEKLEVLRGWGGGLQNDSRAEVAAAGRAIMLLIEEIERLHVLVWDRQLYPDVPIPRPVESLMPTGEPGSPSSLHEALRERLQRGPANAFPQVEPAAEASFHRESPTPTLLSRVRRRRSRPS